MWTKQSGEYKSMLKAGVRHADKMRQLSLPLFDTFGFDLFFHFRINNSGEVVLISNQPDLSYQYFEAGMCQKTPFFKHPSFFSSHVGVVSQIDDCNYQTVSEYTSQTHRYNEILYYLDVQDNEMCLHGFASTKGEVAIYNKAFGEQQLLRQFIRHFIQEGRSFINALWEERGSAKFVGDYFLTRPKGFSSPLSLDKKNNFLKALGLERLPNVSFTKLEREILECYFEHLTAAETAKRIHRSPRTVEHYLDIIREKLNCHKKSEIFQKAKYLL